MRFGGRGDSFVAPDIVQELFFMVSRQQRLSMRKGSKVLPQVWVWGASLDNGRANETTYIFDLSVFCCPFAGTVLICGAVQLLACGVRVFFFKSPTRLDRAKQKN